MTSHYRSGWCFHHDTYFDVFIESDTFATRFVFQLCQFNFQ